MGLDIHAASKAASHYLRGRSDDEAEDEKLFEADDVMYVYANDDFPDQAEGYADGFYRIHGESFGFRAGSYSGYNAWRRHLCLMALDREPEDVWADPEHFAGRPFVELINFSDCEGLIGPKTSAKLARDFAAFAERAEQYVNEHSRPDKSGKGDDEDEVGPWFLESYREWRQAFELAADDGLVRFC
jgi:hypothetical protein